VYLNWNTPPSFIDVYNIDAYQLDPNTTVPVHLGTLFTKDPNITISKLPNGTFVANGFLYGFTVKAVIGTSQSAPSNEVFARPGEFAVAQPLPHRDHPILFLHGVCIPEVSITTDASSWNTTKDFFVESLHWNFGGTLTYFLNNDPRIIPPLVENTNGEAFLDPNGDFFTSSFGNCSGTYKVDGTGILHQADEVRGFLRKLPSQATSKGISIVAHSMGGLSARSYIADNQVEATQLVKEFITYGSPHWGVTRAATDAMVNFSDGANDLKFDCSQIGGSFHADYSGNPFLNRLRLIVLPEGIRYFAIRGESSNLNLPFSFFTSLLLLPSPCFSQLWDGLIQTDSADFNGRSIPPVGGQQFPGSAPSDQVSITPQLTGLLTTNRNHGMEQSDFSAILCALDTNCAILQVKSPVDIEVIAPNGQQMSKDLAAMPGAEYMDILEEDGHETATVLVPFPQGGQYTVKATPKPGTLPTDTFTITLTQNGVTTTIADHVQIQSIPPDGFHPHVNSRPLANASADQTVECTGLNGTPVVLNGSASGDQDGDRLTHSWTDSQGIVVGNGAVVTVLAPMGTHTYNLAVTDPSGLTATAQTHITVRDTTPPAISIIPAQLTFVVNSVPVTRAALGLPTPIVSDKCDPSPRVTDDAPASFSTGTYAITFTATDASGNSARTAIIVNIQLRFTVLNTAILVTQFRQPRIDILGAEISFKLGTGNDGINSLTDAFHFVAAGGSIVLPVDVPLSAFHPLRDGTLIFSGPVNSLPTDIALKPLGGGKYVIVLAITKTTLAGFTNPARITLSLGSDTAQITANALILKK
jgi:pimeloyl-ACP methyl ester carboxylesterase